MRVVYTDIGSDSIWSTKFSYDVCLIRRCSLHYTTLHYDTLCQNFGDQNIEVNNIFCWWPRMVWITTPQLLPASVRAMYLIWGWNSNIYKNLKWFWPCTIVIMSGLRAAQQPANRTHNLQLHTIPTTWKPKHQIPQAANICIILSSSWWWA